MRRPLEIALDALIPHYESDHPVLWKKCFQKERPIEVEIGSGLGEFLIRKAKEEPGCNFVGIEQQWKRAKRILRKIKVARDIEDKKRFVDNVRVLRVDATIAFERLFSPRSIQKIYCLFPCPWPKKKHIKYRLFSNDFFKLMNSRLRKDGEIDIVTDFLPYFEWICDEVKGTGFRSKTKVIKPRFDTKFERKWCQEGQKEFFELHLTKKEHHSVPIKKDHKLKNYFIKDFVPDKFDFSDTKGEAFIVFKEFLFDEKSKKAMVRVMVSEQNISQHLWVTIEKLEKRWRISKTEGISIIPTAGVVNALELVYDAAKRTAEN